DEGCFLDLQLNEVAQNERGADPIVDAFERFAYQAGDFGSFRRAALELALARRETTGSVERRQKRFQRARWTAAVALPVGQRRLHCDVIQPRREPRARWKRLEVVPGGEESLLEHLFGIVNRGAHVSRNDVNGVAVQRLQRRECRTAACSRALGQRLVTPERVVELHVRGHQCAIKAKSGPMSRRHVRASHAGAATLPSVRIPDRWSRPCRYLFG